MNRVKGLKLLWAAGLGLSVFAFAMLGVVQRAPGHPPSMWADYFWPWLSRVLLAFPVVIAALATGVLVRPNRPERSTIVVGAVGGFCLFVAPDAMHLQITVPGEWVWSLSRVFLYAWSYVPPVGVSCWLAVKYWRSNSWKQFWLGPGGAVIKGGLIAGALSIPIWLGIEWYTRPKLAEQMKELGIHDISTVPLHLKVFMRLSGISSGCVITALLVAWRPALMLGAFSGSGLALGIAVLGRTIAVWGETGPALALSQAFYWRRILGMGVSVLRGAIAGIFAGRWTEQTSESAEQ